MELATLPSLRKPLQVPVRSIEGLLENWKKWVLTLPPIYLGVYLAAHVGVGGMGTHVPLSENGPSSRDLVSPSKEVKAHLQGLAWMGWAGAQGCTGTEGPYSEASGADWATCTNGKQFGEEVSETITAGRLPEALPKLAHCCSSPSLVLEEISTACGC